MNLQSSNNKVTGAIKKNGADLVIFRQICRHGLLSFCLMTMQIRNLAAVIIGAFVAISLSASAQGNYYRTNGVEYSIAGSMAGDQVFPDVAISTTGGFVVWQDNITDGSSWGISARRLDGTLSGAFSPFRVNNQGTNSQENPRVALLKNGGAAVVWQGGKPSYQHIFARFFSANETFLTTNDIPVSTFTNNFQINPALTVLNNSNVVVVWGSYNEVGSNSMQDIYGQILSPSGAKIGNEFLINQFTSYNQRTPALTALNNGGFVVAWVSEQQRTVAATTATNVVNAVPSSAPSVDIYARIFDGNAVAQGNEFLVNTNVNPCAHPGLATSSDGDFMVVWDERDMLNSSSNSLDIYLRPCSAAGILGTVERVNTYLYGDQYVPKLAALANDYLVTWTSLGQDGSREGVYAQYVHKDGSLVGSEFCMNTTTVSQQIQPVVASDGVGQFLAVWSSFSANSYNFDLYAQRYLNVATVLQAMPAPSIWVPFPVINGIYQPQLTVTWSPLLGLSVSNYEVYADGSSIPMAIVSTNVFVMTAAYGLTTNSTHSFQVDYVTTDGRRSPISPAASGTTWSGLSWNGIPYEWMAGWFGGYVRGIYYTNAWPAAKAPYVAGGPTLVDIFKTDANPYDPSTWLQGQVLKTPQGLFYTWNTQPGAIYQVLVSTDFITWSNVGAPRFAAGTTDSIYVGGQSAGYYKVVLMR
jgi:hypothetical protein